MKVYLLNAPVLTDYGEYTFKKITVEEAREIVSRHGFTSAIGHESTARILSELLGTEVPVNRVAVTMKTGEAAIVVRIKERLPEGKVLTHDELKRMMAEEKVDLGLLVKTL